MGIRALLLTLSIVAASWTLANLAGTWDLEMTFTSSGTTSRGVCNFKQQDTTLTGTCGPESFPVTGKVDGDKVTWQFQADQGGQKHTMIFNGVIEQGGATIKGKCAIVDGQEGTFIATKR